MLQHSTYVTNLLIIVPRQNCRRQRNVRIVQRRISNRKTSSPFLVMNYFAATAAATFDFRQLAYLHTANERGHESNAEHTSQRRTVLCIRGAANWQSCARQKYSLNAAHIEIADCMHATHYFEYLLETVASRSISKTHRRTHHADAQNESTTVVRRTTPVVDGSPMVERPPNERLRRAAVHALQRITAHPAARCLERSSGHCRVCARRGGSRLNGRVSVSSTSTASGTVSEQRS